MTKKFPCKSLFFILTLLVFASMTFGCTARPAETPVPSPAPIPQPAPTEETPPPAEQEKDISKYMPMKVGYIWEYEGEGNEYASYTLRVEFEEKNKFQLTRDNGGTVIADIYEVREDSIVHIYQAGENYKHTNLLKQLSNLEDVIIKLPIQIGNKWSSEENSYEIIDTKAEITVPYGTFKDCTVIRRVYKDGSEDYLHYKEGIGLLQSEFRSGDFKIFSRLKNFSSK